mmetsp:Transcript_31258/g.70654  ORF Transcript_31258/g.70654 Transcript_31258/m.70654 type:complete len:200 (-) Transcript_31258:686-1285(-)
MVHGPIKPCTMYKNMTNSYAPVRFSIEDNRDNPVGRSPDPSAVPPCMRAVLVMLCLAIRSPILSRRNWTIARRAAGPALFRAPAKAVPCRSCPLRAAALVRPGSPCGGWPGAGECTRRQRRCVPMPEACWHRSSRPRASRRRGSPSRSYTPLGSCPADEGSQARPARRRDPGRRAYSTPSGGGGRVCARRPAGDPGASQ